jgi:CBS domain containing-hemolysin-like protein
MDVTSFSIALIFLLLALGGVVVRKTYNYVPLKELRRRAARHDPLAAKLYRAATYDESLELLLGLFIAVMSAAGFILLARIAPVWLGLLAVALLLWLAFALVPSSRVTAFGSWLTGAVTPFISSLLSYLQPVFGRSSHHLITRRRAQPHTGIFERDDVLELLAQQEQQNDSRLDKNELALLKRALDFTDETVGQIMAPLEKTALVQPTDTIGPVLIDELHRSGLSYVPVTEPDNPAQVIGILPAHKLGLKSQGQVRDLMEADVYYLHEDDSLAAALRVFAVTGSAAAMVVDSAAATVGLITIKAVLGQLIGDATADDFDQYADREAVSKRHASNQPEIDETATEAVDSVPEADQDDETLPETGQTVVE